ncbi:MAG TPA: PEP-CTERM sorting domain-containing protein [Planctomycetota bacterium]|nr:PEP-CTERM sorting domain-containing protein [Planctomycetota bacterium]
MWFGKFLRTGAIAAVVLAGLQLDAAADPISYEGQLEDGVTQYGALPPGEFYDARDADFWYFWATAGDNVTVVARRVDQALDPTLWVYKGIYYSTTDPDMAGGNNYFQPSPYFIDMADDEIPNDPYGDPLSSFVAPWTGWYTAAVTEYASGPLPGDGDYDYSITVRGITGIPTVPEPTLLALLTCGACGVFLSRRRKAAR